MVYPDGHNEENRGHIGVFVKMLSKQCESVSASYILTIIDQVGHNDIETTVISNVFEVNDANSRGFGKLRMRTEMLDPHNGWCKDDSLVIKMSMLSCEVKYSSNAIKTNWYRSAHALLFDSDSADLVIVVEDVQIPAHSFPLMVHSPVFKAMLTSGMKESKNRVVEITDFSEKTVRSWLSCIYDPRNVDEVMNVNETLYFDVFVLAQKYASTDLIELLERQISDSVTVINVLDMLLFADLHNSKNLKTTCMKCIVNNKKQFFWQSGLECENRRCVMQ